MLFLTLILCLFVFSCDDDDNLVFSNIEPTLDERPIPLIKIGEYYCFPDDLTSTLLYPLETNNLELNALIEYSDEHYNSIFINELLVQNNEIYDFGTVTIDDTFTIKTVVGSSEKEYQLIFTTLPTIMFYTNDEIVDEPKISSKIVINDIISEQMFNLFSGIEIRGGTSQQYPKVSYDIELWEDEEGADTEKERLFNLRNDDDWILDAMWIDHSNSRNIIGMNIWESFASATYFEQEGDARLGQSGEYVELFINDEYVGVYSCNEQIDKKQLKLDDDEGLLYKGESWTSSTNFNGIDEDATASNRWSGYELKYPDENLDELLWAPLVDLINLVAYSDDNDFSNTIEQMIDVNNVIQYFIFINLIQALDNNGKNLYLLRYKIGYPIVFAPWDLDITFGNNATVWFGNPDIESIISNNLFNRLYDLNVNNYKNKVKTAWQEINHSNLSLEISNKFTDNINKLIDSNAVTRDNSKWDLNIDYNNELIYINNWIVNRISIFDNYINSNY